MPRDDSPIRSHDEFTILLNRKLDQSGRVQAGELARLLRVTRQTTHRWLSELVARCELIRTGQGRGAHYTRPVVTDTGFDVERAFRLAGAEEDRIWRALESAPVVANLSPEARRIVSVGFSEVFNNAIDHSGGTVAVVRLGERAHRFVFEVEDDGEGVFEHVRRIQRLGSPLDALQDLSKGKVTTAPDRHTGMGLFFTARSMDRFFIESGTLRWTVDALLDDTAFGQIEPRRGTRVHCEIATDSRRSLKTVYDTFSGEDFAFTKSKTWVKLFTSGLQFISRSEGKRLCEGLEKFEVVFLDFKDVNEIGQAFADEVFRVWARAHPATKLVAENTVPPVQLLIDAALRG